MTVEEALQTAKEQMEQAPDPVNDILKIDPETRTIVVPESEILLGVENDEMAERKYFQCPKIVGDNIDLSEMELYVVYQNAGGSADENRDKYHVTDICEEDGYVIFSWKLSRKVTAYKGNVAFAVRAVKAGADGTVQNKWGTTIATGRCLIGMDSEISESEQEKTSEYYVQLLAELNKTVDDKKQEIEQKAAEVKKTIPNDYGELSKNVTAVKEDVEHLKENVGESLKPEDVQNAVDQYMESNTVDGLYFPENVVLFEKNDEEEQITTEKIIGEVLDKMDLRAADENVLALYIGDKLVTSIVLDEFKTSEVICTGIVLDQTVLEAYGKKTIELIATLSPVNCTQKVRWLSSDTDLATVADGTVNLTGHKGSVTITVICGNYKAECKITISSYSYADMNWEIGQISESIGAAFQKTADSQEMRISSDYIQTPVDTIVTLSAGTSYSYQLYKYKDSRLSELTGWIACTGTVEILSDEYSGFALKVRKSNYGKWTADDITNFAKTVEITSA